MSADVDRLRAHVEEEQRAAATYRRLAESADGRTRVVLLRLAAGEERHASEWSAVLERLGGQPPGAPRGTPLASRLLGLLARLVGPTLIVLWMERHEGREITRYADEPHAPPGLVAEEREHARLLSTLAPAWRTRAAGTVRAGVFGVSDGLVSNLALLMGVVAGGAAPRTVVLAGVAGLLAGALSMAVGEYISVSSQEELLGSGLAVDESSEAIGSPLAAGLVSLCAFAAGAAVPLLPYLLGSGTAARAAAVGSSSAALAAVGALTGLLTMRPIGRAVLRQVVFGLGAAGATYLIGALVGVAVA